DSRFDSCREVLIVGRQIEDGLQVLTQQVVQPLYDYVSQEIADCFGGDDPARSDYRPYKKLRIGDPHRILAKGTQPNHSQLRVAKDDGFFGTTFQVLERIASHKHHAGLKWRRAPKWEGNKPAQ